MRSPFAQPLFLDPATTLDRFVLETAVLGVLGVAFQCVAFDQLEDNYGARVVHGVAPRPAAGGGGRTARPADPHTSSLDPPGVKDDDEEERESPRSGSSRA